MANNSTVHLNGPPALPDLPPGAGLRACQIAALAARLPISYRETARLWEEYHGDTALIELAAMDRYRLRTEQTRCAE